ncbi:sensor histidine kinase [Streptomyces sp. SBT349]|uniref:sensor histidine kinase n=1 Tax=Streptomyces sp. SBT349 TaxID=1580539 RepID=UPI0007C74960|nr:sensor histidine kinase [Streptomyces sp. SBT349]
MRTRLAAWGGAALYPLALGLLVGGAPDASSAFLATGSLLALVLLVGTLRRAPLVALVLTLLGSSTVILFRVDRDSERYLSYLAVDVVLACVVATRPRWVWVTAVSLSFAVQSLSIAGLGPDALVGTVVVAALAMATSCMVGLLARERREHAVALRSQEVAEAVTAERLRIARELHDMVAHSIGIIAIQAGVGRRVIATQPGEARAALAAIESTSRETLSGLRRTLVALRQADPEAHAGRAPLVPAPGLGDIDRLAETAADAGVTVEVRREGEPRPLPPDIDLSAYRIVQEAVTNVVRHAGTERCRVLLTHGAEELSLEITDEGRGVGSAAPGTGFGITGMRERVSLLHGRFEVGPRPGGGFRVAAGLPVPVTPGPGPGSVPAPTAASRAESR